MTGSNDFRLPQGGLIDRTRPLHFRFDGRQYQGFDGDTLASALLANGIRVVGRSFKYHRPRGIFSAGVEEPNALVEVEVNGVIRPNARATLVALSDGLVASSQLGWPSVNFDLGRIIDFTRGLWLAGFYNKTFKWPNWSWYENLIRNAAGLGRLRGTDDPTDYGHRNAHCDVLVVGGGPAGLAAALDAGRNGSSVILVEQDGQLGGSLLYNDEEVDGLTAKSRLEDATGELHALGGVRIMTSATVVGYYDHNVVSIHEQAAGSERFWKIRAGQVVLATGAIEQPLVFEHNDRPGVMLAGAVLQYLQRFAVAPGRKTVVATNNDTAYRTAFALHDKGIELTAIVEQRPDISPHLAEAVAKRDIEIIYGSAVSNARGARLLRTVEVTAICDADASDTVPQSKAKRVLGCDLLAVSGGWSPTLNLYSQAGGKLRYDEARACFVAHSCGQAVRVVGAANGDFGFAERQEINTSLPARIIPRGNSARQWIDLLHDVTAADVELAVRENFVSVEHLKRHTTCGMGADQGKTSNLNALTLLATLTERKIADVGTTTFRPQFMPVTMGAIAGGFSGEYYHPERRLPIHNQHADLHAVFEDYGGWERPAYYRRNGEAETRCIEFEVNAVRKSVGIFDGSPLGKIEVIGPDAALFLNRIYVNNMLTLKPGRVRYGFMLNENGVIIDDGVCARLDEQHYLVSTTSGNAGKIVAWLEEWHQCEWPELQLVIADVTSQWAVITLAGCHSRRVLQKLDCDIDLAAEALPHMSIARGQLQRMPIRIQRVSFSGELSFEVSVPANRCAALWAFLLEAGREFDIAPYGIEASMVLRMEKGYLHLGADTDGTTNPIDVGMGRIIDKQQADFVGRRSLSRTNDQHPDRRQLVGLEPVDSDTRFIAGAHIACDRNGRSRSEGFVTSACDSPTLGHAIALGMLERGFAREGEIVTVFDLENRCRARVVKPVFYDPEGERLHG